MHIIYQPAIASKQFATYLHRWTDGQIVYIGACRMSELLAAPDAHLNSEWRKHVTEATIIAVEPLTMYYTLEEAQAATVPLIEQHQPHFNIHGKRIESGKMQIRCTTTGEIFPNASTAARVKGIAQSALSNHLNGRASYNSVKGLRFERVME